MVDVIVLDSGILSEVLRRPQDPTGRPLRQWLAHQLTHRRVVVPSVADYEVRRKLMHLALRDAGHHVLLDRLDALLALASLVYLPMKDPAMRHAAELWAKLRHAGQPTADSAAVDFDVILAAQVVTAGFALERTVVVTTNPKHLSRLVPATTRDQLPTT